MASAGCTSSAERALADAAQAQQLLAAGRPQEAQAVIGKAIAQRDDIAAIFLIQAHIALALKSRGAAYQAYSNALALEATNAEALLGVAQLGLSNGHLAEAAAAADKILSLEPQQTDAMLVKGVIAIVRNDKDGARSDADQILAIKPDDIGGLILKSRVLALAGDRAGAIAVIQQRLAKTGYTPEIAMTLVELYRVTGEAAPYLGALQRLRALAPDNQEYRLDLADALYRTGHIDEAREQVAELIFSSAAEPATLENIVRLWYAHDADPLSPETLDRIARDASNPARLAIARYYLATDRAPAAAQVLRPVATGWSSEIQALFARAQDRMGTDATRQADAILAKDPENGDALLIRGDKLLATGRAAAAVVAAQRVVADYPQWDEGYILLARAYAAAGKPAGVRRAFIDGLHARPQSLPLATAYVAELEKLGEPDQAIVAARRFALDSPALAKGWQLYAAACSRGGGGECRTEAADGLARSQSLFGLDPIPGTPPPIGLLGRLT